MAYDTILSGSFTSSGSREYIRLRCDVDWMTVYNYTVLGAAGAGAGAQFHWQRGMAAGTGIEYIKLVADGSLQSAALTTGGFTLYNSSEDPVGALNATITGVTNAAIPIVTCTSTAGLVAGDVVRFVNVTTGQQLGGFDFTIDTVVANTSFRLPYMAQIAAATNGSFYPIKWDPIYYPRNRYISKISQAVSGVVTLTVTHGYTVGQKVKFTVPAAYGMTELDGVTATITAINTTNNTVTINVDTSGFTAFAFPVSADIPFSPALMSPVGEAATETFANVLDDRTTNVSSIGIELGAGDDGPAGNTGDVIYWIAGKSFDVL